jgi:1,2-diacylglycerol 3-alpha-glucosyltransferase
VHIGLFTDSYLPRASGVVRAVELAGQHLRQRGHRVSIVAPAYPGYTDTDPDVVRFPSLAPPGYPDFPLAVPCSAPHLRELRRLGLDVVHTHSPFLLGGVGLWVARTLHLPVAFTYHTLYGEYAHYMPVLGDLTRPLVIAYTTAYSNRCDRVLVSVPSFVPVLRRYGIQARVEVLPSVGVEVEEFENRSPGQIRDRFGIPAGTQLVLYVGRLAREKGLLLLLEAVACLPANVWLLLVGDGPERTSLRAHAERLGIASRVVFAGVQPHARVVEVLPACDLFAFPSQTETMGLAVLEAMTAGRAVVAIRSDVMSDIVRDGDTGVLTAPDAGAFADALRALLADPARRASIGARARQMSAAFAQDRVTDRLIAVYEAMIAQRTTVPARH